MGVGGGLFPLPICSSFLFIKIIPEFFSKIIDNTEKSSIMIIEKRQDLKRLCQTLGYQKNNAKALEGLALFFYGYD